MKQIVETFKYEDIPIRQMVTIDGTDCWWESTCTEDTDREFQLYQNGDYIRTLPRPIDKKATYYCCDKYGNYLPKSLLIKIRSLEQKAKSDLYKCINTNAIVRQTCIPYEDKSLFYKPMRVKCEIVWHELPDTIGEIYEFLVDDLVQL